MPHSNEAAAPIDERFRSTPAISAALRQAAVVERRSRSGTIRFLVADALRLRGYLPEPDHQHGGGR
jgi:hypothetical protein